jgi:hypothetical protein
VPEQGWAAFIAWARRALAKPGFDEEERDYRLAVAAAVRDLIAAAQDARPLTAPLETVRKRVRESSQALVLPRQLQALMDFAKRDEEGLAAALRAFAGVGDDEERLARFLAQVKARPSAEGLPALLLGSLLAFGASPERLPVVRWALYAKLRDLLGEPAETAADELEAYRLHLAFARTVETTLRDAGVPVRDMLDVDSLIRICVTESEFWAGAGDAADSRRTSTPDVYLAIGTIYRNEAPYLAEWIEFHRLVGAERFYLYDNESDDNHLEVLAPYVEEGLVVIHPWPGSSVTGPELNVIQMGAYEHCIATHAEEARWIAIIDVDEFLFSPTGRPVSEMLTEYERWPAVVANSLKYGPSDVPEQPGDLVTERHTEVLDIWEGQLVKSIVDPSAVTGAFNAHRFVPRAGATVDEHGYPVMHTRAMHRTSFDRLRINHYFARSAEEYREKHARRITDRPLPPGVTPEGRWYANVPGSADAEPEHDRSIFGYLPALRDALRARGGVPSLRETGR